MKKDWDIKKLGEVAKIIYGYTEKASSEKIGPKFLRITDIQDNGVEWESVPYCKITESEFKKYKLSDGDIVFARTGATTGKSYLLSNPPKSVFASYLIKVQINNGELLPEYLYFFFQTNFYWDSINKGISGSAQGGFNATKLSELQIPLPPLPEQQRIVALLNDAFAAIAKAKANAEQNLKNARELFESYLQSVFANKGEDWEEKKLGEVCEFKSGTTIHKSLERDKGDVLYTKVADMNLPENQNEINTSSRFVNSNEIKKNQIIPEGSIIFPKRGGAIATNKKKKIIKPTIVDLNTMAIIPGKKIDEDFLFHWFQQIDLNEISNGTSIPQINNYSFDEVYISYPISLSSQQAIVQKLDVLSAETKKLETNYQQKLNDLEELKKSILQKAFTGELRDGDLVDQKPEN